MVPTTLTLVDRLSVAASSASDAVVPRPLRVAVDRTLVDLVCSGRGIVDVAEQLAVDPPAVDAWRHLGIPPTHRHRVVGLLVRPSALRSVHGCDLAA